MKYPYVFHSFLQEQEHVPKGDGRLEADDVLSVILSAKQDVHYNTTRKENMEKSFPQVDEIGLYAS